MPESVTVMIDYKNYKDPFFTFLAIAAIIGGAVLLASYEASGFSYEEDGDGFFGVIFLAAGLTRLWMKSRFYRKDSN